MSDPANSEFVAVRMDMGDSATVRQNLQELIARARHQGDTITTGFLLQKLGDLEAREGDAKKGHALHREALQLDPDNPLPMLLYAKGLYKAFHRSDLALLELTAMESLLHSGKWTPREDEPPREYYETEAAALRREIVASYA